MKDWVVTKKEKFAVRLVFPFFHQDLTHRRHKQPSHDTPCTRSSSPVALKVQPSTGTSPPQLQAHRLPIFSPASFPTAATSILSGITHHTSKHDRALGARPTNLPVRNALPSARPKCLGPDIRPARRSPRLRLKRPHDPLLGTRTSRRRQTDRRSPGR
jgi:hypothetical protein